MNKTVILTIILIIAAGIGGFFVGKSHHSSRYTFGYTSAGFAARRNIGNPNIQAIRGKIISSSNGVLTISLLGGNSKLVVIGSNTTITKSSTASASDLTAGNQVMVLGAINSDGSITAKSIQINPAYNRTAK